jgi:ribonuclease D
MPTPARPVRLIANQQDLDDFCAGLPSGQSLGLDTEFVRTDTYRAELCLLQIGSPAFIVCTDTLAGLNLTILWAELSRPETLQIVHAAKQDLEVMLQQFGSLPRRLFDTQIAAALLGHPPQMGYAALVETEFGHKLDKTQTRTDWSRRPLSPAQLAYAGDDVAYLPELHELLRARLEAKGRERWAEEDSLTLLNPSLYGTRPERAWERLSGIVYLPPEIQMRARRLAAWRESKAAAVNRPRQWIISDQALMDLAHRNPADIAGIEALDVLPPGTIRKSGLELLAELREAGSDPASGALEVTRETKPDRPDPDRMKQLGQVVQRIAQGLGLSPELLATRKDLTSLLHGQTDIRPLQGWRRPVVGEALLAAV